MHGVNTVQTAQADQRQELLPQAEDLTLVHTMNLVVVDAGDLDDRGERHSKEPPAHAEKQRLNSCESQGRAKLNGGAMTLLRRYLDGALQAVKNRAHDIHADAAAGNFGDFLGGAEAGFKNEVENFRLGQAHNLFLLDDAFFDSVFGGLDEIDSPPIVPNLHDHLPTPLLAVRIA